MPRVHPDPGGGGGGRDPSTGLSWVMFLGFFYMELVRETTLVVYEIGP